MDEKGTYSFTEKNVLVKLTDGSEHNLFEVLTIVINYWEQFLYSSGILSSIRTFSAASDKQPKTRVECEENRLDFEIVQGHRFHQSMRLQRFNYKTGKVEPMDLTGSKVKFNIYKPNYELDLSLTHNASGKEFKKSITLNEGESLAVSQCKTDEERQAYINSLPSAQEALRQLATEAGIVSKPTDTQVTINAESTQHFNRGDRE